MLIFKDVISNDELFSDTYKYKLVHGCVYEVKGKSITRASGGGDINIGANASAEEAAEECEEGVESGIDVCLDARLVETGFGKKKEYQVYIKDYMKAIKTRLEEESPAEVEVFTKGCQEFIKEVLKEFSEYQFFQGESMNAEAMIPLVKWDGEVANVYFFKHGLVEEKV